MSEQPDMHGKRCLVTGANSGMGRATAAALARMGAQVIVACRDQRKAESTRDTLAAETGNTDLDCLWGELASLAQVRTMANEFLAREQPLDVLVNNAGMISAARTLTVDGIEQTFAVNHLACFLLTTALLPALERAPRARIVTVASDVHRIARYDADNLQLERGYGAYRAYALSKLANIMFTHELARRLRGTNVTANCCHPGYVGSNFGNSSNVVFRAIMRLSRPFLASTEKGAQTAIHLASSPEVEGISGQYFVNRKVAKPARIAVDDARTRELWEISERLIAASAA
jgi:NAD(P)-dependent dehydrogenase (short-subunit alcohol dehydrogenase family)